MRIRSILAALSLAAACAGAALAGVYTPIGATGGSYRFEACASPAEPDLGVDPALKGRDFVKARNAAVARYNAYVGQIDAYLACITGEAERDLLAHYAAVSAALEAEQASVIGRADALRAALAAPGRTGGT